MTGKIFCVNFDVANAISGVHVKFAGGDYSPMLPRVCNLFTCHIETIKRKLTNYGKHGMYSIYYLTSKRIGDNSTKLNGLIAFETVKEALVEAPILAFPDISPDADPFILDADANNHAKGAVLSHKGADGKEHVIAYGSRTLDKAERNY